MASFGIEERDPMRLTEDNAFCFGAIGLPDSNDAAIRRERWDCIDEEHATAEKRAAAYEMKVWYRHNVDPSRMEPDRTFRPDCSWPEPF